MSHIRSVTNSATRSAACSTLAPLRAPLGEGALGQRPIGQREAGQAVRPAPYLAHSPASRRALSQLRVAVASPRPVLLCGAPGTGKRTLAELIHHFGDAQRRFVELDPEGLAAGDETGDETGHETGDKPGETLGDDFVYLCPIETLPPDRQLAWFEALGERRAVIGTRLDPRRPEQRGAIHPALLERCKVKLYLPTLAERLGDLEALCSWFIAAMPPRRPVGGISFEALERLRRHDWPGNVSELEQVLAAALAAGTRECIELRDLPADLHLRGVRPRPPAPDEELALTVIERNAICRALAHTRGNRRQAARVLRIGKTTLYRKLAAYGLE